MTTHDLRDTLTARADRSADTDVDAMLAGVRHRVAERHARRRRTTIAATGGAVAVAAVVGGTLLIAPGEHRTTTPGGTHQASRPRVSVTHPTPATPPTTEPVTSAVSSPRGTSTPTRAAKPTHLVPGDPAPGAPVALGKVPAGWVYLGKSEVSATYGPPGGTDRSPDSYLGKIAVLIGERYDQTTTFPLTIAGYPGRIDVSPPDHAAVVFVVVSKTLEITIQVPDSAGLTHAQLVTMANSLEIRDLSHHAVG